MQTIVDQARQGIIAPPVTSVAEAEKIDPGVLSANIAGGSVVIMQRGKRSLAIGRGLPTRVNVNLGTSTGRISVEAEVEKALISEKFGADTISDLSMGGDIDTIRETILGVTTLPLTTVPIYQAAASIGLKQMTAEDIIRTLRLQAAQGISSCVIHCVSIEMLEALRGNRRIMGLVSKGGSITSAYMMLNRCENPFIEHFDEVLSICRQNDIVLSLGNTARSGCIHDRRDKVQIMEMRLNADLARRAHAEGVQVIIEGAGGHIRADRIARYVKSYKRESEFPLFVAGPLPTDIAVGYDHMAGCVGASIASGAGADYLCYITPAEHLGLPGPGQVKEGLIAFRIAAHIGDTVKLHREEKDRDIAIKRAALDREGQIQCAPDPGRARELSSGDSECTMCGEFCAIKIMKEFF
jgi:phosphomethylpyrimidine synthase